MKITFKMSIHGKKGRDEIKETEGTIALIKVGDKKHRFVIHNENLSDYGTGRRVGELGAIKIERMARISSYTRTTDRQAAAILIERIIAKYGVDGFHAEIARYPKLNP